MFKLKLLDGNVIEIHSYQDFLLLRFANSEAIKTPHFGRKLFERNLNGVTEVIAAETEILLKVNSEFDVNQLAELEAAMPVGFRQVQEHSLPVLFSQHDEHWERIEKHCGLKRQYYIDELLACPLTVAMSGFLPGFVYLDGLPEKLHVPRRSTPANRTQPGSFAIGGKYAGVYSLASPAGWNVVGRTSKKLFRLDQLPPLTVEVGDSIQLQPVDELPSEPTCEIEQNDIGSMSNDEGQFTVIRPGMLTLIQDQGRRGLAYFAIPPSGALDSDSADLANVLLGNAADAAVVECHLVAPEIRFDSDATICLTGADMNWTVNGEKVRRNRPLRVSSGSVISGGKASDGCRSYIGIHGFIQCRNTFGSASAYSLGGFGGNDGQPLIANQTVQWSPPKNRCPGITYRSWSKRESGPNLHLEITRGPEFDWLDEESKKRLTHSAFLVSRNSDRMGARLDGPTLSTPKAMQASVPLLPGMIQLTSGGQCIVVLNDGQTTGGYPRIGYLSKNERTRFVQICPGQKFRFAIAEQGSTGRCSSRSPERNSFPGD